MLINTEKIISIINKKREEIHKCTSKLGTDCIVTLIGEHNEVLTSGVTHTGDSEYGDSIYWEEEVTEVTFQYLTIEHITYWLKADRAIVRADGKIIHLSL